MMFEKRKRNKKSANITMIVATKRIYIKPARKLHQRFNELQETSVSLNTFYNMKPFCCLKPSEKEKQSCLCINCLNPHVILKAINCC